MKTLYGFLIACCMLIAQQGYSQNNALDLGGDDDFASIFLAGTTLEGDPSNYTAEIWFKSHNSSTNTNCVDNFRRLLTLNGINTRLEIGECGNDLNFFLDIPGQTVPITSFASITQGTWYHLALVKTGNQLEIFLDCVSVYTLTQTGLPHIRSFIVGRWGGLPTWPAQEWLGQVDEVRFWETSVNNADLCTRQFCPLSGQESDLFLYWSFNEGIAGGNNTALTMVTDFSPNGNDGTFSLTYPLIGPNRNYVNSTAPMVYPALHDLGLEIREYPYRNNLLTGICDGEPVHICLDDNGQTPGPYANVSVQWESSDDTGATWTPITTPSFLDFCFPVAPNEMVVPCSGSPDGFVDRKYRAISTVTGPTSVQCTYVSDEYGLQICCPISTPTLSVVPSGPFCEGDAATFNVSMTSPDPFITTPGPHVTIDWYFVDPFLGTRTLVHSGGGSFSYSHTFPTVPGMGPGPHSYCFEVEITNCQGKFGLFSECVNVDPQPECGTIAGSPLGSPQNLTLVTTSPHLTYEICPGNDAILEIASPFIDCIPQWQYTFDNPNLVTSPTWVNIGFSNSIQNTNILPSYYWPAGATCIYYRIECQPLSSPSGCDPCYSDWIEIQLTQAPAVPTINGPVQVCLQDLPTTLAVNAPVAGITYTWIWDGMVVGTDTSYQAIEQEGGCYWLEGSNGCQVVAGPQHCMEVCETIAVISCPLPNECACLGEPITLSACASENTCSGNTGNALIYLWSTGDTTCTITDTPAAGGTTYYVTVTDPATGCVGVAERKVVPCDKNE